ncbi:interferon gamma receptor 2 isoform X2 [Sciurus carolinensis]|uniref:interferon gamma receptor 2 isoform X2 n=1 Tax=Sciurus carolinensis TaxID=30640 RepID=UPI001FB2CC93|nr:interferon gamma receptor 2 isoform X2 [Sciurus carolinensis]
MRPQPWLWLPLPLPLLLLCCPRAAAPPPDSLSQLAAPLHPKIHLYNEKQVLRWEAPSPGNGTRPVVYRVQFKYTTGEWQDVQSTGVNCTQITATECDFTATSLADGFLPHFNVYLRVRAELGELASAWVTLPGFQHYQNVTIGPPKHIVVTPRKGTLVVRLSPPFHVDSSLATFWYYVHYEETPGIQQVRGPFKSNFFLLDGLKPFRRYCLQFEARLSWMAQSTPRPGQLSNTSCYETTADASTKLKQVILISVGVFTLLLALAGACFFLVLKYRELVKYCFHTPPSIPAQIEEYLKDPVQPILEALDKDSSPKDDTWDSVSIISFPEKEREDVLQML